MGIFKRRRAVQEQAEAPRPESSEPQSDRFRRVPVKTVSLGVENELVYDQVAGRSHCLSYSAGEVLHACGTFDAPEGHARRIAGWGAGDNRTALFAEGLSQLADAGLLITYQDAVEQIARHRRRAPAPAITTIGVVTQNRPELLARCLRSYAANVVRYGHEAELVVLDDSTDPDARGRCRAALALLRDELGLPVSYAGCEEKQSFAEALCEAGAGPGNVVEFALFDRCGSGYSTGANRNALALHANGEAYLSVDDDTVGEFAAAPGSNDTPALSSTQDPTEFSWFTDRDTLLATVDWCDVDILSEHSRYLGRDPGECFDVSTGVCLDRADDALLANALTGRSQVVATTIGIAGDSGMASPGYYMLLRGAQRQRIAGDDELYERLRLTREIFRSVSRPTLSAGMYFMSTHFALDGGELLPPFFPVLRNSDGIFGRTLRQIRADGLIAHLPFGVRHEPLNPRNFDKAALWNWCATPRMAEIVIACILSARLAAREPAARLRELGHYLIALGDLPAPEFDETVRVMLWEHRAVNLQLCESLLMHYGERPALWAEDLSFAAKQIRKSLAKPDFLAPRDLRNIEGVEAATLSRALVGRYGQLLVAWPDIHAAACTLRSAGTRLAQPL